MRSSRGRPDAWYFLAIDTTSRRFDWTKVRSASSPSSHMALELAPLGRREVLAALVELGAGVVADLDRLGQPDLVVLGQQGVLPDVGEVQADEVFFVPLYSLLGQHLDPSSDSVHAGAARRHDALLRVIHRVLRPSRDQTVRPLVGVYPG